MCSCYTAFKLNEQKAPSAVLFCLETYLLHCGFKNLKQSIHVYIFNTVIYGPLQVSCLQYL